LDTLLVKAAENHLNKIFYLGLVHQQKLPCQHEKLAGCIEKLPGGHEKLPGPPEEAPHLPEKPSSQAWPQFQCHCDDQPTYLGTERKSNY